MSTHLIDVVNFNPDASSLQSEKWFRILEDGDRSVLCSWLRAYVENEKPVNLGFIGGAVADIAGHNPEAIRLINDNPRFFQVLLRPFSHDVALLRTQAGFELNYKLGEEVLRNEFANIANCYLPPEFMLTNDQVYFLSKQGIDCLFLHPSRFTNGTGYRLPAEPYLVTTFLGRRTPCVPFHDRLTDCYLAAIQQLRIDLWDQNLNQERKDTYCWRDGESPFLLPDGIARERWWLQKDRTKRLLLSEALPRNEYREPREGELHSYPVHSFQAWFREFRMLGFLQRVFALEQNLATLGNEGRLIWLQTIGSDILSSVEKSGNIVELRRLSDPEVVDQYVIRRTERGFEGEEYLAILESYGKSREVREYVATSKAPHIRKLRTRMNYLLRVGKSHPGGSSPR